MSWCALNVWPCFRFIQSAVDTVGSVLHGKMLKLFYYCQEEKEKLWPCKKGKCFSVICKIFETVFNE